MYWLKNIARPDILALTPYCSARSEYQGGGQVQLDANENPEKPYGQNTEGLNRYPQPQPENLKQRLAEIYGVNANQLLITRGMDEGIDLLLRTFCRPYQDFITITPPTFGYYEVSGNINGVGVIKAPLNNNFEVNWDNVENIANAKIIFLCTPNNPTGQLIDIKLIKLLCDRYKGRTLIAVDEAYIEFSGADSATMLLAECENLVVMRTLSKAYGLAGERIGAMIANTAIIDLMKKIIPPYPIARSCIQIAVAALSPIGLMYTRKRVEQIKKERDYVYEQLQYSKKIKKVYNSAANFLLVISDDAENLYQDLKSKGIIVRKRMQEIPGALRISIGTPEENKLLLIALDLMQYEENTILRVVKTRKTKETEIMCEVILDNKGRSNIKTGIGFFDHMLDQLSRHSGISIDIQAIGDTNIDAHHTVEDVAIVLGSALKEILGDKRGINRYGFLLPMDETEAKVSIDLSGRGYCRFEAVLTSPQVGDFPSEMAKHFFESLSNNMGASMHIAVTGENTHHMIEAMFKSVAKALKQAITIDGDQLLSTKGVL